MSAEPAADRSVRAAVVQIDPCTDTANAARFAADHQGVVRYAEGLGWRLWDSARYGPDETGERFRLARDTITNLFTEAMGDKKLSRWAATSSSRRSLEAMLKLAESELGIVCRAGAFDRNPYLFNCGSGIIDLKTGRTTTHDPSAMLTKLAPTFYSETARCPRFLAFLDRIMGGDVALIEFLQRALGYSLTGLTVEQVMFLLYGIGANGKTVLLEMMRAVMGDYAMSTAASTFLLRRNEGGPRSDLVRLRGARLASAVEMEDGGRLAEALIKQVTGGDTITARDLFKSELEFRPQFKLWLASNHKPIITGTDYAIWRRVRLIPFSVQIPPAERDKDLLAKLIEESAGVLRWMVEGCLSWQKVGLAEPDAVLLATQDYREQMDPLADFLAERCVVSGPGDPELRARSSLLYKAFREWADANGRDVMSNTRFSLRLEERGFRKDRDRAGACFVGIGLR